MIRISKGWDGIIAFSRFNFLIRINKIWELDGNKKTLTGAKWIILTNRAAINVEIEGVIRADTWITFKAARILNTKSVGWAWKQHFINKRESQVGNETSNREAFIRITFNILNWALKYNWTISLQNIISWTWVVQTIYLFNLWWSNWNVASREN